MVKCLIKMSGKVRRRFNRLPHWARDIFGLVKYANVFQLLPTLCVIGCAPDHFFKRLPRTLRSSRALHPTPVRFLSQTIAFFIIVSYGAFEDLEQIVDRTSAQVMFFLGVLVLPILMTILAAVLFIIFHLIRLTPGGSDVEPPDDVVLVLKPSTYRGMDTKRYFWGLFYLVVYSALAWLFALGASIAIGAATIVVTSQIQDNAIFFGTVVLLALGLIAIVLYSLVFRPYAEMVKAARRPPA